MNQSKELLMKINLSICVHCGACAYLCSTGALTTKDADPVIDKPDQCSNCGTCEEVCPTGAISLPFIIQFQTNTLPAKT